MALSSEVSLPKFPILAVAKPNNKLHSDVPAAAMRQLGRG